MASTAQGVGVAGTDHTSATTKCHLSEMNCKKKDTEGGEKGRDKPQNKTNILLLIFETAMRSAAKGIATYGAVAD